MKSSRHFQNAILGCHCWLASSAHDRPRRHCWTSQQWHPSSLRASSPASRRGAAILLVMVALLVTSAIVASMVEGVIRQQKQQRLMRARHQAEWCLQAGLLRGQLLAARDPQYTGEVWTVTVPASAPKRPDETGRIEILVVSDAAEPGEPPARRVMVMARFPAEGSSQVQVRQELILPATTSASALSALTPENQ